MAALCCVCCLLARSCRASRRRRRNPAAEDPGLTFAGVARAEHGSWLAEAGLHGVMQAVHPLGPWRYVGGVGSSPIGAAAQVCYKAHNGD